MRKKSARQAKHHKSAVHRTTERYIVVVRSWMFVVAFALMLGLGAVLGGFFQTQLNASTPQVAGASVEVK